MAINTFTNKNLFHSAPATGGNSTLYTAPADTTAVVKEIIVCNPQTSKGYFDLFVVPSGGAAGTGNQILSDVPIEAGETKFLHLETVLETGDFLVAYSTTAQLTYTGSGLEVT